MVLISIAITRVPFLSGNILYKSVSTVYLWIDVDLSNIAKINICKTGENSSCLDRKGGNVHKRDSRKVNVNFLENHAGKIAEYKILSKQRLEKREGDINFNKEKNIIFFLNLS